MRTWGPPSSASAQPTPTRASSPSSNTAWWTARASLASNRPLWVIVSLLVSAPRLIRLGNCTVNKAFKCAKKGVHTIDPPGCMPRHKWLSWRLESRASPCNTYTSFLINPPPSRPRQGEIYILSPLDRETKDHYTLTAVARDNPGGSPNNRRENSVQVKNTDCRSDQKLQRYLKGWFRFLDIGPQCAAINQWKPFQQISSSLSKFAQFAGARLAPPYITPKGNTR